MAELDPIFAIEAEALGQIVDELDYFQVLEVPQNARPEELKEAYFRKSRQYHPDQYFALEDGALKVAIGRIYKRVNEAYVCLRDDRKRLKYVTDINGPDRARKLRYTEASEEELRRAAQAEQGQTAQARKTFGQGLVDLAGGRFAQAQQNFRLALQFEPQNALFKQKLEEAIRLASGQK